MSWLPFLRLRFPMKVDVKNPRLICLFYVVQVLTFVFFSIMFWLLDMWAAKTPVGRFIYPTLAVNGLLYQERLQEVWAAGSQKPFCTSPDRFDYRWDAEGLSTYSNHTCLPLCRANESGLHHKCVHLAETYIAQNVEEVFITTQVQDTTLPADEQQHAGAVQNHFIPTAEGLGVSIRFTYEVPIPPRLQLPAWTQSDFHQNSISGSSTRDVVTVVLDADGNLWRKFLPGEEIQFSIPTLLALAGEHELLDTPQPHLGRNMLPGAAIPEGPIARLTGLGLEFGLECFDRHYVTVPGHDSAYQCLLRVRAFLPGWFSVEHSDLLDKDGHRRHRLSHGIRVNVRTGGNFRFFSFAGMLRFSTYMIVLMALPSQLVLFIAVTFLGHLSVVYKKVLFKNFDIYERVGGFATRLMSSSAAFVLLDDTKGNGISKSRMHERLSTAASARVSTVGSDKQVIQRFVDYCWHSAVKERTLRASSLQDMMTSVSGEFSEALRPRRKSQVDDIHLDLEHFSKACTNNEDIPFEVLVGMFSKHRKRKFLERIFTPSNVSRYLVSDAEELPRDDCEAASVTSSSSDASNATGVVSVAESYPRSFGSRSQRITESSEMPVYVSRTKRRARTLEQTKVELDSDHVRIQNLENSLFSVEGRLTKLLEELDLRLSNLECKMKDGLGGVESRTRSLERTAEHLEKRHADVLEKLERRLREQHEAVAETVSESVAEALAAHQLLAKLPDFETQLSELMQLYQQIQPGLQEPGVEAAHANFPDEEVEMPEVAGMAYDPYGYQSAYHEAWDDPYGYQQSGYHEAWNVNPEIVPNGEHAEPVSYAEIHNMFNTSPRSSPRAARASSSRRSTPRARASSRSPRSSPRATQANGSEWQQSVRALAQHVETRTQTVVPARQESVGLQQHRAIGRALSPSTLRSQESVGLQQHHAIGRALSPSTLRVAEVRHGA